MPEPRDTPDYTCPGCGQVAAIAMSGQAFCGNNSDCKVMAWNPMERYTEADLATMHHIDMSNWDVT
jgi:hypothetical protein